MMAGLKQSRSYLKKLLGAIGRGEIELEDWGQFEAAGREVFGQMQAAGSTPKKLAPEDEPTIAEIRALANTEIKGDEMSKEQVRAIKQARVLYWTYKDTMGIKQTVHPKSGFDYSRVKAGFEPTRPKPGTEAYEWEKGVVEEGGGTMPEPGETEGASKAAKASLRARRKEERIAAMSPIERNVKYMNEAAHIAEQMPGVPDAKGKTFSEAEIQGAQTLLQRGQTPELGEVTAKTRRANEVEQGIEEFVADRRAKAAAGPLAQDLWHLKAPYEAVVDPVLGNVLPNPFMNEEESGQWFDERLQSLKFWEPPAGPAKTKPKMPFISQAPPEAGGAKHTAPSMLGRNKWGENYLQWLKREQVLRRNAGVTTPPQAQPRKAVGKSPGLVAKQAAKQATKEEKKKKKLAFWKYKTKG